MGEREPYENSISMGGQFPYLEFYLHIVPCNGIIYKYASERDTEGTKKYITQI